MKNFKSTAVVFLVGVLFGFSSNAALFCANTIEAIEFSLAAAESNGEADVIRVVQGVYDVPSGGLAYISSESFDLTISGGWSEAFGDACGQQAPANAFNTILDGNTTDRIMLLGIDDDADLAVTNLFFANGFAFNGERAGGLLVVPTAVHTGRVFIENNAFINNQAGLASALSISGSDHMVVRNNLFVANKNQTGMTVELNQTDGYGVYFTNNTVYQNSQLSTAANHRQTQGVGNGLRVFVDGSSQALIANNILWANEINDLAMLGNGFKYLKHNNTGITAGVADVVVNNMAAEPMFEVGLFNYTPSVGSPMINAGIEPAPVPIFEHTWSLGGLDLLGNDRLQMGGVDLGAVESDLLDIVFADGF